MLVYAYDYNIAGNNMSILSKILPPSAIIYRLYNNIILLTARHNVYFFTIQGLNQFLGCNVLNIVYM